MKSRVQVLAAMGRWIEASEEAAALVASDPDAEQWKQLQISTALASGAPVEEVIELARAWPKSGFDDGLDDLVLAALLAVAGESALMGEPEVRFGSAVVAMLAPFVMGPKHAKELLLTGQDRVSAQRCHEMGLLTRVVPDGGELGAAMDLAEKVASAAPRSVQLTKRAMNRTYERAAMRDALVDSLDHSIMIEADESPERSEFNRIRKEQGLKAALDWRDRSAGR
jgi:hypothetical protein